MTKQFSALIVMLFFYSIPAVNAQVWEWQNPRPIGEYLDEIIFVDSLHGWVASEYAPALLRTTDAGKTWELNSTGKKWTDKIYFIDSLNGWAVGRGRPPFIIRTTDGGKSWRDLDIPQQLKSDNKIIANVIFLNLLKGFILVEGSVFSTLDGGLTWEKIDFSQNESVSNIFFLDSLYGFFSGASTLIKTTDGGISWFSKPSLDYTPGRKIVFKDSLYGWIMEFNQVRRTTDAGSTWTGYMIDTLIKYTEQGATNISFPDYKHGWVYTGYGLYSTSDSGKTWININKTYSFVKIFFLNENIGWATGTTVLPVVYNITNKLYRTSDGGKTWTSYSKSSGNLDWNSVDFTDEFHGWAVGTAGVVVHTSDGGLNWTEKFASPNSLNWVGFQDTLNGWTCGSAGKIFRSTDGGKIWEDLSISSSMYNFTTACFLTPLKGWIAGGTNRFNGLIFHTTNAGKPWIDQTPEGIQNVSGIYFIDSLKGWAVSGSSIYKTTDGGNSWVIQYTSDVKCTNVLFIDSLIGFVDCGGGLLKTTDGGTTWNKKEIFSNYFGFYAFTFLDANKGWAIDWDGAMAYTSDGGDNWVFGKTFTSTLFYDIDFIDENRGWIVGEHGAILRTNKGGITSVNYSDKIIPVNGFDLFQNYPNPFNPTTTIKYDIPNEGFITLKIYDILGNEITTLVNQVKPAGSHEAEFDASSLASGVYIYTIQVNSSKGGYLDAKKMIVLK